MKCSFCEEPLICKSCGKAFRPQRGETHLAVFQPDMEVKCPECAKVLICKMCGYVFGEVEEDA
jgi:DNA-directed RNA polymerase subunit RPC12/RpoP